MRLMATQDDMTGPINIENPVEFSIGELATQVIELIGSRSSIVKRRCRRTIRDSGGPIFQRPRRSSTGSRAFNSKRGSLARLDISKTC
jgi:hypothetical protein